MGHALRLLIVADTESGAAPVLRALRASHYHPDYERVATAATMSAALEQGPWHVVVVDAPLAQLSVSTALALAHDAGLPALVIADEADEAAIVAAVKAGACDYLVKSRLGRLAATVERALRTATDRQSGRCTDTLHAHLLALVEAMPDLVAMTDADGELRYLNQGGRRLLGLTADEDTARSAGVYVGLSEARVRAAINHGLWQGEGVLSKQDGQSVPVAQTIIAHRSLAGAVTALSTIAHDISPYRQATASLRASEKQFRRLIERSPDGIVILDTAGAIQLANSAFIRLLGAGESSDLIGRRLLDFVAPEQRDELTDYLAMAARNQAEAVQCEGRFATVDGSPLLLELDASASTWAGRPAVQIVARDIGERRSAEDRIRREAERAKALVRVSARLNAQLDLQAVLQAVCEETARALDVPIAGISLYDKRSGTLSHAGDFGLPPQYRRSAHLIPRLFATGSTQRMGQLLVLPDVRAVITPSDAGLFTGMDLRTVAGARLLREDQRVGVLYVATCGQTRIFTDEELDLLKGLANQAVQAITNARLLEEAQRRLAYFQALHTIDMATNSTLDMRVVFNVVLDHIVAQLKVDAAAVLLLNQHWQMLEYASGRGFQATGMNRFRLRLHEDHAGRAVLERRLISVPNLAESDEPFARAHLLASERFVAYYAVPLIAKGQVKGVLELFHRSPLDPNSEWLNFLDALAAQAALAIENATLFNDLERSNVELTLAYDATIEGWSRALELRDKETEGHTLRVTELTLRLARAVGMSEAELVHVRRGALLHDIGKMGIPDQILLKSGPLTDEEWEIMRQHPVYAYEMLAPISFLRPALDIPYCHHERWDGTGYPRGLKGEQIPLAARIFAVADVWDALRSSRPYRASWQSDRVLQHIRAQAGSHFDPAVVRAFLEMTRPAT